MNQITGRAKETGVGLFSGEKISLEIAPPTENGLLFVLKDGQRALLTPSNVSTGFHNTVLNLPHGELRLIEHLLSACSSLGITHANFYVDGKEIPIFDGSAMSYLILLKEAGFSTFRREFLKLNSPVKVQEGPYWAEVLPANTPLFDVSISFPAPIGAQSIRYEHSPENYEREIARARTFGVIDSLEKARELYRGATLENVVIISRGRLLTQPRFPDEFVRHKVLDAAGDLWVLGSLLLAEYRGHGASHKLNQLLVKEMTASLEKITFSSRDPLPVPARSFMTA